MAILGMWVWAQNVQRHGAEWVADICHQAGVTDLFFLTKGIAGTTAFQSRFAPGMCDRDLLHELLDAAHKRGMRVHAWLTSACDEHYKALHPESGRCHYVRGKDRELISLADEGYLRYMEQIVQELCRSYDIDGLHLDYIRYNHLLYGWAKEDLARYAAAGADPAALQGMMERMYVQQPGEENLLFDAYRAGDANALALAQARRTDVVRFAFILTSLARAQKNGLLLSAALMPEGAYEDVAFADLHYGQNYEDAAGLYDFVLPMAYAQAYGKNAQWVREVATGTLKHGLKTIMGLHAYEGGTGPLLQQDLAALKDVPVQGVCLFREGACVLACAEGKTLRLWNALEEPMTQVEVLAGEEKLTLQQTILPGERGEWKTPFAVSTVRVWTGEKERCVYLAGSWRK